ncbi:MAG: DUF1214 domain-containing protein [Rhizomicrobium sp.]
MNAAIKATATVIAGIALGLGATWFTVVRHIPETIGDGPWRTNLQIGSESSDLYTRASVALNGLFAIDRSGVVYYVATTDSAGDALRGDCQYEVSGHDPDSRWWSLTAYGADDYLIANPANRYFVDKTSIWRPAGRSFSVAVGSTPQPSNWVPVTGSSFNLVLRLFEPAAPIAATPQRADLPAIRRTGCT